MYENEKVIQARYLEYIKKYAGINTRRGFIILKKSSLFNNQIKIILPQGFHESEHDHVKHMSSSDYHLRADITNHDNSIHFAFHLIDHSLEGVSAESVIHDFYKIIKRLHPKSECLGTGNGTGVKFPYTWTEFTKNTVNENLYHMLVAVPLDERLLLFLFGCPFDEYSEWKQGLIKIREGITL